MPRERKTRTFSTSPLQRPTLTATKFSVGFPADNSNKEQPRTKYPPEFDWRFASETAELVICSRTLLCSQGTQRRAITKRRSPPSFSAEDAERGWCPTSPARPAEPSPAPGSGDLQVPDVSEPKARLAFCVIRSLTAYSRHAEDNPHRPHERSAQHRYTCLHGNLNVSRKLRIAAPPTVMSAKDVGADSREERGRLGEQCSHRQPATEKQNPTW